jgi:hypothetical protein
MVQVYNVYLSKSRHALHFAMEGVYFKCRNCHGRTTHASWEKAGEGVNFVWATDLFGDVYGIHLLDFDDQEVWWHGVVLVWFTTVNIYRYLSIVGVIFYRI